MAKLNNKKMTHLLYREINGVLNTLFAMCDDDIEKLEEIHEELPFILLRLLDIRDWGEEKYDLFKKSEKWYEEGYSKELDEFAKEGLDNEECCCCDCRQIKDEILELAGCKKGEGACISCIEKALGRKLTDDDYVPYKVDDKKLLN